VTRAYRAAIKTSLCIAMLIRRESSAEPQSRAAAPTQLQQVNYKSNQIHAATSSNYKRPRLTAERPLRFVSGRILGADYKVQKLFRRGE